MLGVEGITQRIAQINTQIASLTPPGLNRPQGGLGFAAVLDRAVTVRAGRPTAPATTTPALATTSPGSTALRNGVPVELSSYGNGKIPATALSGIGVGQHRLWAPAAQAFQQLSAAAAREGIDITVTDSYRSFAQQVDVAERKGLYSNGGLAAKPGTSDHGWGRSLDLGLNATAQTWMRDNATRFGFRENVPREPWHWTFTPQT